MGVALTNGGRVTNTKRRDLSGSVGVTGAGAATTVINYGTIIGNSGTAISMTGSFNDHRAAVAPGAS